MNNQQKAPFFTKSGMMVEPEFSTADRLNKRAARFGDMNRNERPFNKKRKTLDLANSISQAFSIDNGEDIDWTSMHIVGTSTALEKQYLRLTSVSFS